MTRKMALFLIRHRKLCLTFIVSGDPCRQNKDSSMALDSEISDDTFSVDRGSYFPRDGHDTCCELRDSGGNIQVSDFNHGDCLLVHDDEEAEGSPDLQNNNFGEKVNASGTGEQSIVEYSDRDLLLVEEPSFRGEFDRSSPHQLKNRVNLENLQAGSSSNQKRLFFWVEDYKCSLCGVELPSSFIDERQEHSDFHLAEKLQEEESGDSHRSLTPKQRLTPRDQIINHSKPRKKQKSSPKDRKHVPIDRYFAKASQNF